MDMKLIALNVLVRDASGFVCFFCFLFLLHKEGVYTLCQ